MKNYADGGFSLIEVMVASAILVIVLVGGAGISLAVIRSVTYNRKMLQASNLAQAKLEELSLVAYADADLADTDSSNNSDLGSTVTVEHSDLLNPIDATGVNNDEGGEYTRIWNVADDTPSAGMKRITVVVTWTDYRENSIQLTMARAQ